MNSKQIALKVLVAAALSAGLSIAAPAQAAPTLTYAQLFNGTNGVWTAYPTSEGCGGFHLFVIAGSDPYGTILNPAGGISLPLSEGTQTLTFLGDDGSQSQTAERTFHFYFDGSPTPVTIYKSNPAPVTYTTGITQITISNFTYADPLDGPYLDRIAVCGTYADGYADTVVGVTFTVTTVTPQQQTAAIADLVDAVGLAASDADALNVKLDAAMEALAKGSKTAARGKLGAFKNQVDALVRSGRLSGASGQSLQAAVDAVLARI